MRQPEKHLAFAARSEESPGQKLAPWFHRVWPAYHRWFSLRSNPADAAQGKEQLSFHMPELLPIYDAFCHSLNADEEMASFLTLYNPPAFRAGCSQAAWSREPCSLLRNYDFPPHLCDRQLLYSRWNDTGVIAMTDCLWGVLDGMNEHGLALSLAYGGREQRGEGFAITLVLRYILECCHTVEQAIKVLQRIPLHMPYNVTLLDMSGVVRTVSTCPGERSEVNHFPFATNHQAGGLRDDLDSTADSYMRESYLATRLADPAQTQEELLAMFMRPPLLRKASEWRGWGTLYTAQYSPGDGKVELHWPGGQVMTQSFHNFEEMRLEITSPGFQ